MATVKARGKFYQATYTDEFGNRVRRSTGVAVPNRQEALDVANAWETSARHIRIHGKEPDRTLSEVLVVYLEHLAANDKPAPESTKNAIRLHLRPYFANSKPVNDWQVFDIHNYVEFRQKRGASNSTIRREIAVLSAAINVCRKFKGWKLDNVCKGIAPPPNRNKLRWLTKDEAYRLIEAANGLCKSFIIIGLSTGCRPQELLGLKQKDVDFANDCFYISAGNAKNREAQKVPLNEAAKSELIKIIRPDSEWVFCHNDGTRHQSVKKAFKNACERAGIENATPHTLRHTTASWLAQSGTPLVVIKELLRHKSIQTTLIYAHLAPSNTKEAVDGLNIPNGDDSNILDLSNYQKRIKA